MAAVFDDPLTDRDHQRVARYVAEVAGIQLPRGKRSLIEGRLRKRQRALKLASLKAYIDYALDGHEQTDERIHLVDAITTNKTDFYREDGHFRTLRAEIEQTWAPRRAAGWGRPLRLWSAGCSTGEEPYTLAMEMLELRRAYPGFKFEILATDISLSCLDTGRRGIYPHRRIEPIPLDLRRRYLLRSRDRTRDLVKMAPEVRETVRFESFNLLTDAYEFRAPFDVVFCRNVMIYFDQNDRAEITRRFAHALSSDGLLFIGHSETLGERGHAFEQIVPTVYRKTLPVASLARR